MGFKTARKMDGLRIRLLLLLLLSSLSSTMPTKGFAYLLNVATTTKLCTRIERVKKEKDPPRRARLPGLLWFFPCQTQIGIVVFCISNVDHALTIPV